jgi:hypothetical protein
MGGKYLVLKRKTTFKLTLFNARTDLIALKVVTRAIMEHIHLKRNKKIIFHHGHYLQATIIVIVE